MAQDPPPVDLGDLTDNLGFLLALARTEASRRLIDGGAPPVAPVDLTILRVVQLNPGIRQGVVGQALKLKRAHMTKLIQRMEGLGLVATTVPPEDRRALGLTLTDAGRATLARHWPVLNAAEARVPGSLSAEDTATLCRLLRAFLAAAPDPEPES